MLQSCPTLGNPTDRNPQAPVSTRLYRQEYWSRLLCPPPRDLPAPGMEPVSLTSSALAGRFFTSSATWEALLSTILLHGYTTVYLPIDKYFGCFQFGAIVNSFYKHSCTSCFVNLSLHIVFPVFLAGLHSMQDLSSQSRDQTCAPGSGRAESTT